MRTSPSVTAYIIRCSSVIRLDPWRAKSYSSGSGLPIRRRPRRPERRMCGCRGEQHSVRHPADRREEELGEKQCGEDGEGEQRSGATDPAAGSPPPQVGAGQRPPKRREPADLSEMRGAAPVLGLHVDSQIGEAV